MVPHETISQLQYLASLSKFKEVCGVVDTLGNYYEVPNMSQANHFLMAKSYYFATLNRIKSLGAEVECIWHSHIDGDPTPSQDDLNYIQRSKTNALIVTPNKYVWVEYAA